MSYHVAVVDNSIKERGGLSSDRIEIHSGGKLKSLSNFLYSGLFTLDTFKRSYSFPFGLRVH